MIKIDNLSLVLDKNIILESVNCTFEEGKITALLGHNGCGKSMLLRSICNYNYDYQGNISIFNKNVKDYSDRDRARSISYLPQDFPKIDSLTVRELVLYGRYPIRGAYLPYTEEDYQKVDEAIELAGLSNFMDRFLIQLSGGERQRAWISMVLATNSKILLLDEPISALDVKYQIEIIKLIKNINLFQNKTVIWVLHNLDYAINYSDNVIALKKGKVQFSGISQEFANKNVLKDVFETDFEIFCKDDIFYTRAVI